MAIFPCDQKGLCLDPANPFQNFSAEAPDQKTYIGFNTGFGPTDFYPPLGSDFFQVGCRSFCVSTVSQQDADQCAARTNVECLSSVWPTATPGIDIFGNPVPIYRQRQVFLNHAQSVIILCPDGQPFTYTVPAGRYAAFSQEDADQAALSDAAEHAPLFIICISDLTATQTCPDEPYAASITASGMTLTDANVCWDLIGTLPPGISSNIQDVGNCLTGSRTLNFHGTPTTPGVYTFSIRASDDLGDFMVKQFTIRVEGIADVNPLPDATEGDAYSQTLTAIGVTNPIYSLEDGSLPAGLSLDSTGVIFGTPTVDGDFTFTLGVTEAGTGKTCLVDASIHIENGLCAVMPTQTRNVVLPDNYDSVAFANGGNLALLGAGLTPLLSLYDVKNGGFALQTFTTPVNFAGNLTQGRVVWSPKAGPIVMGVPQGEWVYFATDAATTTEAWFTSYNKTTLAQTGQAQGVAVGAPQAEAWTLISSASTGIVYGSLDAGAIQSYNSVTHVIAATTALPGSMGYLHYGSISLDEIGGTLYVAAGGNNVIPGPAGLFYLDPATLALKPGINPMPLPNATGRGLAVACVFNPDNGMVYVAGNDGGGDGGDVIWVVNPAAQTIVATIRMLAPMWDVANIVAFAVPQTLIYDAAAHQIYVFAALASVMARIHVICCDTNTRIGSFALAADADLGDIVFADIHDTLPVQVTNTILTVNAFGAPAFSGQLLGYTFP